MIKNYFLITSLFFLLTTISKAQTNIYHPFPDNNAVWGMSSGCIDVNCGDFAYIKYYYSGDTVIDGIIYKKVIKEVLPLTNGNCCVVGEGLGAGLLRQDTAAKKVYWRAQWMNSDTLLYDFTLNISDTLNDFLQIIGVSPLTVVSIDSILIGASYRKRINIDTNTIEPQLNYSIIEGVGSTDGFAAPHFNNMGTGIILSCFSENGNVIYTPPNFPQDTIPCGSLPVSVNDFHQQSDELISLFPNPSSGKLTLTSKEEYLPLKVVVYDTFGRKRLQIEINMEYSEIDISALSQGIYYLRVESNKTLLTIKKIIKQ